MQFETLTTKESVMDKISLEMTRAKSLLARRQAGAQIPDFDIRGGLYALAFEVAPEARKSDIQLMQSWIMPQPGEITADLAAGGGFLTKPLTDWVRGSVYAIDPSREQLTHLHRAVPSARCIVIGSDDKRLLDQVQPESLDLVTSFGGLHHAVDQKQLILNIETMLKVGGRCVVGDIQAGSALSRHFDEVVAQKSLTGHAGITWWSEEYIHELIAGTKLELVRSEPVTNHVWTFASEHQMALFFKALHAYDLPEEEIVADLKAALGVKHVNGQIQLSWPMFLFELKKH